MDSPADEMEVIGPAVEGTTNVLEACANTKGGVKRVVLTSSCAAVYGMALLNNNNNNNNNNYCFLGNRRFRSTCSKL